LCSRERSGHVGLRVHDQHSVNVRPGARDRLLVDDAIVVVENVERVMSEEGLVAARGDRKAMGQITGALVGVAVVLSAVFIPVAFSGGSVGAIYRQFSLTIVSAMLLSVFVALSLTPALCAMMRSRRATGAGHRKKGLLRCVQSCVRALGATSTVAGCAMSSVASLVGCLSMER